jgi:hypothetical protein
LTAGELTLRHRVAAQLLPANDGPPIDATAAPGACVLELSLGFSNRPDRLAGAPLTFGPG